MSVFVAILLRTLLRKSCDRQTAGFSDRSNGPLRFLGRASGVGVRSSELATFLPAPPGFTQSEELTASLSQRALCTAR